MATVSVTEIVNGNEVEILFCRNGFGIEFRSYTDRPYAVEVNGRILRTAGGAKRTFGNKAAAIKAGRAFAEALPLGDFGTKIEPRESLSHPCG